MALFDPTYFTENVSGSGRRLISIDPGSVGVGANPSASVGLAVVNGAATTFMRSDGAPALSQAITPTWTGLHAHSRAVTSGASENVVDIQGSVAAGTSATVKGLYSKLLASGGTITLGVGVDVDRARTSGTFTTAIGLRINAVSGTIGTDIAIQSLGGEHRLVGNVQIGQNTAPSVELSVFAGTTPRIHLHSTSSGSTSTDGFQLALSTVDAYLWNFENGPLHIATNNTERVTMPAAGGFNIKNFLNVGALTNPSNTTDGDATWIRGFGTSVLLTGQLRQVNYKVKARGTGTQSIAAATVTALTFTSADEYDSGTMHDSSSNTTKLVAPIAGKYHITGGCQWAAEALSTTTLLLLRLSINGAAMAGGRLYFPPISSLATNGQGMSVGIDVTMAANDYVELEVFFDAGASNRNIDSANSAFSMFYIGD